MHANQTEILYVKNLSCAEVDIIQNQGQYS